MHYFPKIKTKKQNQTQYFYLIFRTAVDPEAVSPSSNPFSSVAHTAPYDLKMVAYLIMSYHVFVEQTKMRPHIRLHIAYIHKCWGDTIYLVRSTKRL